MALSMSVSGGAVNARHDLDPEYRARLKNVDRSKTKDNLILASVSKNDSIKSNVCVAGAANPLRSRYSESLTLSILRVKNSLSLTVFTQLQRREASRLE